jgi:hypothetical protein
MTQAGGTLELKLVREGSCPGLLTVDSGRRSVRWDETRTEGGCEAGFEVSFDDVKTVRLRSEPGFLLELLAGKGKRMALLPEPHGGWFAKLHAAPGAGASWSTTENELPADVAADTRHAVDRVLEMLGRPTAPATALREALHGPPADTTIAAVLESPGSYSGKAVRLRGRLEAMAGDPAAYRLSDGDHVLAVVPETELAVFIQPQVAAWKDQEVELVGLFRRSEEVRPGSAGHLLSFWACAADRYSTFDEGKRTTVAALLATPAASLGETVRVVGKFRGRNLFGDLPRQSKPPGEWVIKDDRYAIWVTGKPQTDTGFTLDPGAPGDTSSWLEVVGKPVVRGGRVTLQAQRVAVVAAPPGARVLPPRQILVGPESSPAVVFALPLEAELVPPDVRFVIQFSKTMEEESFRGRVQVRYAGAGGDSEFRVTARYDEEHRSLVVDPGTPLRVGAHVEIALLPGIIDTDGMPLEPRPGRQGDGGVDVLRYTVGGQR